MRQGFLLGIRTRVIASCWSANLDNHTNSCLAAAAVRISNRLCCTCCPKRSLAHMAARSESFLERISSSIGAAAAPIQALMGAARRL